MVAIVGHLVVKLVGRRVKLEHPLEAPARFVEQVGQAVRARVALGVDAVGEARSPGRGASAQLIGQEHLGRGVAGGDVVLQQVAGVVPAAAGVDLCPGGQGTVGGAAVELVALARAAMGCSRTAAGA